MAADSPHVLNPGFVDATIEEANPGAAAAAGDTSPGPSETNPGATGRPIEAAAPDRPANESELDRADRLFEAGRYDDAGRGYAALARQDRLPTDRRPHGAYCREVDVVRKINARPRSPREWDEIEAEIQRIQKLMPGNWFGEYLRNRVAEARGAGRTT
jgi:hypothetical protein